MIVMVIVITVGMATPKTKAPSSKNLIPQLSAEPAYAGETK